MSVTWVLGGLQHLSSVYSVGLAILRNSVSVWLWPNTQESKLKVGRSILILGVRELNPWLQQDQVADESLQFLRGRKRTWTRWSFENCSPGGFLTTNYTNFLHHPPPQKKRKKKEKQSHHQLGTRVEHEPVEEQLTVKHTSYTEGVPGLCVCRVIPHGSSVSHGFLRVMVV